MAIQSSDKNKERLYLGGRIFLGIVFLWASWSKIYDPQGFARILQNYQILPQALVNPAAVLLPWTEALCGLLLISGYLVRGSSLIVNMLMLTFIAAFMINFYRGIDVSCGCFSVAVRQTRGTFWYLFRELLFLGTGVWVFCYSLKKDSLRRRSSVGVSGAGA
ncbi:MAG: DoxX family membrane protein [Desulfobacterales bacterium]|nr:MAG: DoxX family membrane protein [Desulfobacterales bacterium]